MPEPTAPDTAHEGFQRGEPLLAVKPHLFVVLECDRPLEGGARYALDGVDEVVLGRGEGRAAVRSKVEGRARLSVTLPGKWLSTTHARITLDAGRWVVEDAGSKNGTFVNGHRVERATLADGDSIVVGRSLLSFRAALPTPSSAPRDLDLRGQSGGGVTLLPLGMAKLDELRVVSGSPISVLLLGETGTGKELLAGVVHAASKREGELVAVNCAALSATLLESLLFGHARGAFSGAVRDEPGFVRSADRGTLFLDEIGDLPKPAQAALLRVVQEREVTAVGAVRPVKVDVRFVAATHQSLQMLTRKGGFREDLFARLNGYAHALPPLRERREDMGVLVAALLARALGPAASGATLSIVAGQALFDYDWPANVRELEQCILRAVSLARGEPIEVAHFPGAVAAASHRPPPSSGESEAPRSKDDDALRARLVEELRRHKGSVSEVARSMRKARMQIQRWLKRFRIDATEFKD